MLSILIPNYNQNVTKLVHQLNEQLKINGCVAEIIVGDDGSDIPVYETNRLVEQLEDVRMIRMDNQVGRARIRNILAKEAQYNYLLFIDSDAFVVNLDYLKKYLTFHGNSEVLVGGVFYQEFVPENPKQILRWKYGRKKEEKPAETRKRNPYSSFSTFNFLISKEAFQSVQFNESIKEYGHEDTLFGYELLIRNIPIVHIDNPLLHTGLDENDVFLEKTRISLKNLSNLFVEMNFNKTFQKQVSLLRTYNFIKEFRLLGIIKLKFKLFRRILENNLTGKSPSVWLFQLYKLGYYCSVADKV